MRPDPEMKKAIEVYEASLAEKEHGGDEVVRTQSVKDT